MVFYPSFLASIIFYGFAISLEFSAMKNGINNLVSVSLTTENSDDFLAFVEKFLEICNAEIGLSKRIEELKVLINESNTNLVFFQYLKQITLFNEIEASDRLGEDFVNCIKNTIPDHDYLIQIDREVYSTKFSENRSFSTFLEKLGNYINRQQIEPTEPYLGDYPLTDHSNKTLIRAAVIAGTVCIIVAGISSYFNI